MDVDGEDVGLGSEEGKEDGNIGYGHHASEEYNGHTLESHDHVLSIKNTNFISALYQNSRAVNVIQEFINDNQNVLQFENVG